MSYTNLTGFSVLVLCDAMSLCEPVVACNKTKLITAQLFHHNAFSKVYSTALKARLKVNSC